MKYIYSFIAGVMLIFTACSPDELGLGAKDVKPDELVEGIAFTVTPDASNPNIIRLQSRMKGYTCLWEHSQGRSQAESVDLNLAFPGTYTVKFGVETRGGVVYGEPYNFVVTTTCLAFVEDQLWTNLTGGVGHSKVWIPNDYDYGLGATGELTYADPSQTHEFGNWSGNWDPGKGWTGDENIFTSSMTFSLSAETGTVVTIVDNTTGGVGEVVGKYMLDKDARTLSFTDCSILHTGGYDSNSTNWRSGLKLFTLNENFLQVGIMRDNDEGPWWMVLNFVSKDFADSFVKTEPEPALPDGWKDGIEQNAVVTTKIEWKLSDKNPFDWSDLTGTLANGWSVISDYPDWLGGTLNAASYAGFSLVLESTDHTYVYTTPEGTSVTGEYTLDEKGIYTFSEELPSFTLVGWASFATTADNQLRILKIEKDALGKVSGMWLGKRDPSKAEYMAYHLIAKAQGGGTDLTTAYKSALVNKTFIPDVNWFIDWVAFDSSGGWTSASTFGDDYTSNGWVWDANVRQVAESATLSFKESDGNVTASFAYTKYDGTLVEVSGEVVIDTEAASLTFEFPLVDYTGTVASWLPSTNAMGSGFTTPLAENEWLFISHGGSNLTNVAANGIWLGAVTNTDGAGEIVAFHWIVK